MKWIIVAIWFMGDMPIDSNVLGRPGATQAECEEARAMLIAKAEERGLEVWAECREVKRAEKPAPVLPPPKPTDGDGISLDGKRRGGNS